MNIFMVKALIDADMLVGLIHHDDAHHLTSQSIIAKYSTSLIYITPYTIPETATVLSHKVSQKIAIQFIQFSKDQNWELLDTNDRIINLTNDLFCSQTKKGISWIDCLNCVMVKIHHLDGIFSFDKFYTHQNIRMIK
jgi:predicted nucleic acid-binding protein